MLASRQALVDKCKHDTMSIKELQFTQLKLMTALEDKDIAIANLKLEIEQISEFRDFVQTQSLSSSADGSTIFPADHEPNNFLGNCGIVNTDVKTEDDSDDCIDHQNNIAPDPASYPINWESLFLELKSQTAQQTHELREEIKEKDKLLAKQRKEMKKLQQRVADLVHEDNMDHLARQQAIAIYSSHSDSSSDTASVSSQQSQGKTTTKSVVTMEDKRRREVETEYITRVGGAAVTLARRYSPDRYPVIDVSKPDCVTDPARLPDCVPVEMFALWLHHDDIELTPDEQLRYDRYLQQQVRPPPIHSPHLRKPCVNWNKLNQFQLKNLPQAQPFPLQSCSPDPEFYLEMDPPASYYHQPTLKWNREDHKYPFGYLYGHNTNMGIVSVPTLPIHGYRCSPVSGGWEIDARGG